MHSFHAHILLSAFLRIRVITVPVLNFYYRATFIFVSPRGTPLSMVDRVFMFPYVFAGIYVFH